MSSEVDRVIDQANETLHRTRARHGTVGQRSRALRRQHALNKVVRMVIASALVLFAAGAFGALVTPLGFVGIVATLLALVTVILVFARWPAFPEPQVEDLGGGDLKTLAARTEVWLERQRPALPPPAQVLVDRIGVQLDLLSPQLATLDPGDPAARSVRKLVAEELPGLVTGYRAIPAGLRKESGAAGSPDRQLVEGLTVVEREVGVMARQLAAGHMDQLETRRRYLEIKYDAPMGGSDSGTPLSADAGDSGVPLPRSLSAEHRTD